MKAPREPFSFAHRIIIVGMYALKEKTMNDLVGWYRLNRRSFPWRDTGDPFDVWISEIMLQQTRTEAVISYFNRFKEEIPDISSLAGIEEEKLMRLWEGLGYYSRAHNLKKCAIKLEEEYAGRIPEDHALLLRLPGIGPYTAGAIMAIAYGRPYAAIDGNVLRVLSRFFGIREDIRSDEVRKQLSGIVEDAYEKEKITDRRFIADLTQAFMDLGATICIPNGKADCENCPLKEDCYACQNDLTKEIPYRSANKERKILDRTIFIIRNADRFLLNRRPQKGLLAGMYEFIGTDEKTDENKAKEYLKKEGFDVLQMRRLPSSKHIFTHMEWHMDAYEVKIGDFNLPLKEGQILASKDELQQLAIPSAFRTYTDYYALREERE